MVLRPAAVLTRSRTLLLDHDCSAMQALALLAPEDQAAILDGRLFVGRRRIRGLDERLRIGQTVTWNAPRFVASPDECSANLVIECREGLVAASKPAAWSSEPDRTGSTTALRDQLVRVLGAKALHIATRLDVGVSGLVLAATNAESRRHLAQCVGSGDCHRSYLAVVAGNLRDRGSWQGSVDWTSSVKSCPVVTHFECIARLNLGSNLVLGQESAIRAASLLLLRPKTGRRHQLRIHCSRAGSPILGDRRYGGPTRFVDAEGRVTPIERILLHALATSVPLPRLGRWQPYCPVPEDFQGFWELLGGSVRDMAGLQP